MKSRKEALPSAEAKPEVSLHQHDGYSSMPKIWKQSKGPGSHDDVVDDHEIERVDKDQGTLDVDIGKGERDAAVQHEQNRP